MRVPTLCSLLLALATPVAAAGRYLPRDGDIVFHTSNSTQSVAIQRATKSSYTHMGIVFLNGGKPVVLEAVEPVKLTPLGQWLARGNRGHFVVKRLRDAADLLTPRALDRIRAVGKDFEGKHYDLTFEWSDDRIYCSELVWKVFQRALGVELGDLQKISDFDLSDQVVQAKIRERWGGSPPPNEPVISPAAVFNSHLLVTVYQR